MGYKITKINPLKIAQDFEDLLKCAKFAKSSHTASD